MLGGSTANVGEAGGGGDSSVGGGVGSRAGADGASAFFSRGGFGFTPSLPLPSRLLKRPSASFPTEKLHCLLQLDYMSSAALSAALEAMMWAMLEIGNGVTG